MSESLAHTAYLNIENENRWADHWGVRAVMESGMAVERARAPPECIQYSDLGPLESMCVVFPSVRYI